MDGAPVFNLVRHALPATRIASLRGILNSTTNYILTQMEQGTPFDTALRYAQSQGIAEADPTMDIDGWDAAAKLSILIQALMGSKVGLQDISRTGISADTGKLVRAAVAKTPAPEGIQCTHVDLPHAQKRDVIQWSNSVL